jgi:lincosamide and streptogramin A transport system ATP-binding/permease protein
MIRAYQTPLWQTGVLRHIIDEEKIDETRFRQIMGAFGVSGEIFDRPLETFSQGERKKVDLCRSFLAPRHLLLWDEPLNYIDLMSREQIETVILEQEPTLLFVDHDRRFIESVATEIVELQ